jgi:hypothetical protein
MSKAQVRKFLSGRSTQQLLQELLILHDRIPAVRDYFDARLATETAAKTFAKFVGQIDQEFSTSARKPTGRPSHGRQILRAYKQVCASHEDFIELTLYYASAVLTFMETFGIVEDAYIGTVESTFREAAELAAEHNVQDALSASFTNIIDQAMNIYDSLGVELRAIAAMHSL